jgi:hypothetical protein
MGENGKKIFEVDEKIQGVWTLQFLLTYYFIQFMASFWP